jgi:hypothetical protein
VKTLTLAPFPSLNLLIEYSEQLYSAQLRRGSGGTQSADTARNMQGHRIFCNEKVEFRPAAHTVLEAGDSKVSVWVLGELLDHYRRLH